MSVHVSSPIINIEIGGLGGFKSPESLWPLTKNPVRALRPHGLSQIHLVLFDSKLEECRSAMISCPLLICFTCKAKTLGEGSKWPPPSDQDWHWPGHAYSFKRSWFLQTRVHWWFVGKCWEESKRRASMDCWFCAWFYYVWGDSIMFEAEDLRRNTSHKLGRLWSWRSSK